MWCIVMMLFSVSVSRFAVFECSLKYVPVTDAEAHQDVYYQFANRNIDSSRYEWNWWDAREAMHAWQTELEEYRGSNDNRNNIDDNN